MTTDEIVIAQLAEANPVPVSASPAARGGAEAERILRRVLADAPTPRRPRPRLGWLAPVVSVLVVLVVVAVVLRTGGSSTTGAGSNGGLTISLSAQPTPQTPRVTASAMAREIALLRRRLASVGHGFTVTRSGVTGIVAAGPEAAAAQRARILRLITQRAQLFFYDWEANVLTPNGKTVASQLLTQDPTALSISEGGRSGAGTPGGGGLPLYQAAKLAAKQPSVPLSPHQSRHGPAYYLFGAPGSAACAASAKADNTTVVQGQHCLLSGPDTSTTSLYQGLPAGVTKAEGELVTVPQGTVVLQAATVSASVQSKPPRPTAQFYVLKDNVSLTGNEITNPAASTDESGSPDVTFGFTGIGQTAFRHTTQAIARRGANVTVGGSPLNQHFAVALDSQLVTVPQISFRQYPDGIIGGGGADITGGFTRQSARDLATELRYGALPLALRVVP